VTAYIVPFQTYSLSNMVNPGAGAPAGNVVSMMAALFERSGRVNPFSPSLLLSLANGV